AIGLESLLRIIAEQMPKLGPRERAWWSAQRIEPESVALHERLYFAVARSDQVTLLYFDQFGRFGKAARAPWDQSLILYEDLCEATRRLAADEDAGRIYARATAESLEVYERADSKLRRRMLETLRAFGADAAAAVPKLIEITRDGNATGGLQEL